VGANHQSVGRTDRLNFAGSRTRVDARPLTSWRPETVVNGSRLKQLTAYSAALPAPVPCRFQEYVKFTYQTTFTIEKEIAERAFLFAECVGTFPANGRNNQLFNSGAGYRMDKNQQIDFHIGFGLDREASSYVFGLGYSFRFDGVFRRSS
jgi:hypothetical protein